MTYDDEHPRACGLCEGAGWIEFPARAVGEYRPFKYRIGEREENGSQYKFVIPCLCSKGKGLPQGFDKELQDRIVEWKRSQVFVS